MVVDTTTSHTHSLTHPPTTSTPSLLSVVFRLGVLVTLRVLVGLGGSHCAQGTTMQMRGSRVVAVRSRPVTGLARARPAARGRDARAREPRVKIELPEFFSRNFCMVAIVRFMNLELKASRSLYRKPQSKIHPGSVGINSRSLISTMHYYCA